MDEPAHVPVDTTTAVPAKSILKNKCSYERDSHHHHHDHHDHDHHDHRHGSHDDGRHRHGHISHIKANSKSDCTTDESEHAAAHRRAKWDEMNILATYHPANKDYGHMKIDDPPTPYHEYTQQMVDDDENMDATDSTSGFSLRERKASFSDTTPEMLDADTIAQKLNNPNSKHASKAISSDSDDESNMTEDELAKKNAFKLKRKQHYNEFEAMKLAKQLLEDDDDDEEEEKAVSGAMV